MHYDVLAANKCLGHSAALYFLSIQCSFYSICQKACAAFNSQNTFLLPSRWLHEKIRASTGFLDAGIPTQKFIYRSDKMLIRMRTNWFGQQNTSNVFENAGK